MHWGALWGSIFLWKNEEKDTDNSELVARVNFDSGVSLRNLAMTLASTVKSAEPYSIFGLNGWMWSRYLTLNIVDIWKSYVLSVELQNNTKVDTSVLLTDFLSDPWIRWGQSVVSGTSAPLQLRRLLSWTGIPFSAHLYDTFFPHNSLLFVRRMLLTVTPEGAFTVRGLKIDAAPHIFVHDWAVDSNSSRWDGLSSPGDFLYLLTDPINVDPTRRIDSISLLVNGQAQDVSGRQHGLFGRCTGFEAAIVRHGPGDTLHAAQRFEVSGNHRSSHESVGSVLGRQDHDGAFRMRGDHEIVRQFSSGDMVGVWARAKCAGWENHVFSASVRVLTGPKH